MSKFKKGQLIAKVARGFIPGAEIVWETAIVIETTAENPELLSADEETVMVKLLVDGEVRYDNEVFYSSIEDAQAYEAMF